MFQFLFMGPISPPFTGQSVAFKALLDYYKKNSDSKLIEVDLSNQNGIFKGFILCFRISFLVISKKIDLIYFTCSRSFLGSIRDVILLFWARIFKIKVVNHLHGGDFSVFYENSPFLYKKILKWCYNGISTNIVLLEGMRSQFQEFPNVELKVVSNSYSTSLDNYPLVKGFQKSKSLNFLYLSNIMESKGILNLLDAFHLVLEKKNKLSITIAGDFIGDYLSSKTLIAKKFLSKYESLKEKYPDQINYIGPVRGKQKDDLLWDSDVFILPTFHKTEAFPISLLEALRTGNYIISTNHNYIPQIISNANGILITPNSVSDLEQSIFDILNLDSADLNKIQNNNIQYSISSFKEEVYIYGVKNVINEVLSDNSDV